MITREKLAENVGKRIRQIREKCHAFFHAKYPVGKILKLSLAMKRVLKKEEGMATIMKCNECGTKELAKKYFSFT